MSSSTISHFRILDLPPELRDEIYDLTILADSRSCEVDIFSKCKPYTTLSLVSKQVRREAEDVMTRKKWPCQHTHFSFTLWDPRESIDDVMKRLGFSGPRGMRRAKDHGNLDNTAQLRVISTNSGKDNPLAVTITFPLVGASDVPLLRVYGASVGRQRELEERFLEDMRSIELRALGSKGKVVEELVIRLRIALHRVW